MALSHCGYVLQSLGQICAQIVGIFQAYVQTQQPPCVWLCVQRTQAVRDRWHDQALEPAPAGAQTE